MKFSEQWLREWVNPDVDADTLAAELTMAGLEVDKVESVANDFTGVCIGKVLSVEKHPNAEKLNLTQVDIGDNQVLSIVCGAKNVHADALVPVATIGARLSDDFKIKKTKLRGEVSEGMICSASELGLAEKSEGILLLPQDAPIGQDLRLYLQLNDRSIDIDLTPNRGDCLSLLGIAREVAVKHECTVNELEIEALSTKHEETLEVTLSEPEVCSHYVGRIIRDINLEASTPIWLQERLRRSGLRSIDPVVDVTNFVMLELGQPMHAFDLAKINGAIDVRFAVEGEGLTLLDGKTITLGASALLIADNEKALALAGIMGGEFSGVSSETKDIFLESAFFKPEHIAVEARRYGLHTDSSHRFERGVDPSLQIKAIERATQLLLEIVGGRPGPLTEALDETALPQSSLVQLRPARVNELLGVVIEEEVLLGILQRLGMQVYTQGQVWDVHVPTYRFDISFEVDLIEEIARIYGYDNIPTTVPRVSMQAEVSGETKLEINRCVDVMVDRDYHEVITYSFVDPDLQAQLFPSHVSKNLLNPISKELSQMRVSLWPSLLTTLRYNQNRQHNRVRIFETGMCFLSQESGLSQTNKIAGLAMGTFAQEQWAESNRPIDFYDIKADVEALLALTARSSEFTFVKAEHSCLHPGQSAEIQLNGASCGFVGALHPKFLDALDLRGPVFLFELDLPSLMELKLPQFTTFSKYPSNRRDLSFTVDQKVTAQDILDCVRSEASDILTDVNIFDVYEGKNLENNQKSMAISLILQHPSRTLTEADMNPEIDNVIKRLKKQLKIKLRD